MKALIYSTDAANVTTFETVAVPADMLEEAEEWRGKLIEEVANVDDTLLARYLEDHESITAEEILTALRKSTIDGLAIPVICGAAFQK